MEGDHYYSAVPEMNFEQALFPSGNNLVSPTDIQQRGVDIRSGSVIVRDQSGNILTMGLLPSGSLGMQVINSSGTVLFDAFNTDVSSLSAHLGFGSSTPFTNAVLHGSGAGTSVWATTLAGLTLTAPVIGDFTQATHTHENATGGSKLNLPSVANAVAYSAFTPTPTGFSGTPTTTLARYIQHGKLVTMDISFTGTSNSTACGFTLPAAANSNASYPVIVTNNGAAQTLPGLLSLSSGSSTASLSLDLTGTNFTNVGTKAIKGFGITYEAN